MSWTLTTVNQDKAREEFRSGDARFERVRPHAGGDADFGIYLYVCDRICQAEIGVGIFDLSDYGWRDAFDDAAEPRDAVTAAIANDDTFGAMR